MKNYLTEHLNKDFILSSSASYASLILFVEKKDNSLRFCINYRKLNALIKWNHYSLLLIDETFACIQESKYLIQLNIIVMFNKLRMHSDNEDLTIFITSFNFYKYHMMSFKLINDSTFYQHYMNDVLFNYLHQFCQIYLDDIIIYSKTLKKHKQHVWLVLHRLQETDLQMNINKCEFHVQKIFFVKLLLFIEELKMNLRKVQAVVEWSTFTNLTQMQFFIDFCNFYQRFIKNFLKIIHSLIQLTQKKWYLNKIKLVKQSLIIWRNKWLKLLFFVILIRIERLFLKQTHSTTSMMTYFLNMMMKKHCIQWSTTVRIWASLSAITRSMTRNY